jgi:hypothetical protein
MAKEARTRPGGRVVHIRDVTANNSNKTFTVPVGKMWEMRLIFATLLATAVVGNRALVVDIGNGVANIWYCVRPLNAAATESVGVAYSPWKSTADNVGLLRIDTGDALTRIQRDFLPPFILPAGYTIRIWDTTAVDPAGDDLCVVLHYIEYDA